MSCQHTLDEWTTIIRTHVPRLSKPQATVLALGSLGMALARSCALTAVGTFLATRLDRKEETVRQQLREFCYGANAKRGAQRQALVAVLNCQRALAGPCGAGQRATTHTRVACRRWTRRNGLPYLRIAYLHASAFLLQEEDRA